MATVTLTSKRQATFPKEMCDALGLKLGDVIELESRTAGGEKVWFLRRQTARKREWVGCLGPQVRKVQDHSMAAVRKSIVAGAKGRGKRLPDRSTTDTSIH